MYGHGVFDSSQDSTTSSVAESQRSQELSSSWQRGCYMLYSSGACNRPDCPYLHDLSDPAIRRLLSWKQQPQQQQQQPHQHVIFDSNSNSSYPSTSQSRDSIKSRDSRESRDRESSPGGEQEPMAALMKEAASLPSMGPERQQLLRRLRKHFKGISDRQLAGILPRDERGRSSSIGSLLHRLGTCKPCRNMVAKPQCSDGLRCCFCHLPHNFMSSAPAEEGIEGTDMRRPGFRPCKNQRAQYRKVVEDFEAEICRDPFAWSPDSVDLPDEVFQGRPDLRSKFFMRMAEVVDRAKTEFVRTGRGPSSSSALARSTPGNAVGSQSQSKPSSAPVRGERLVRL